MVRVKIGRVNRGTTVADGVGDRNADAELDHVNDGVSVANGVGDGSGDADHAKDVITVADGWQNSARYRCHHCR